MILLDNIIGSGSPISGARCPTSQLGVEKTSFPNVSFGKQMTAKVSNSLHHNRISRLWKKGVHPLREDSPRPVIR